nr:FAD-dependent oxidoreductase [Paracoccaceae bacterium]
LFDHGAPELQVTCDEFDGFLASLGAVGANGSRYGAPGMRFLFDALADRVDLRQDVRITSLSRELGGWVLRTGSGRSYAHFSDVIITVPAPQARELVASIEPRLADEIDAVRMHPVWTCLAAFDAPLALIPSVSGDPILRADRMNAKPGRQDDREAWVIHMTPDYARETLTIDPAVIAPAILEEFADAFGLNLPAVRYLDAHRWRYAYAEEPLGRPFLGAPEKRLVVGGDWTLGERAEHGFQSGRAMAQSLLSRAGATV